MSRNRKPLSEQVGNLTVAQQENIKQTEQLLNTGDEQLDDVPDWLVDCVAIEEYERLVKELRKAGLAGNLDKNNIAIYCNCYSEYLKICESMKRAMVDETSLDTDLIKVQRGLIDDMMKISRTCGLTIDSRLKAGQIKVDKTNDEIEEAFGDI